MRSFSISNVARAAAVSAVLLMLPGCATAYLDSGLPELKPEDKVTVANPQPVQLLFEFQTKGVANGQATDFTKKFAQDAVQASGLFSQVSTDPAPNGALLHISINNVPLEDDAFAKGFVTGFTFGLVGSTVGDGYICTVDYQAGSNTQQVTKTTRDAIYTSLGATNGPEHAEKMSSLPAAVETMTRRVISNALNQMAKDQDFAGPAAASAAPAPAPAATTAAPTNS